MLARTLQGINNFQSDRALELLTLVEEAHKRYDAIYPLINPETKRRNLKTTFDYKTLAPQNWAWEKDLNQNVKISYWAAKNVGDLPEIVQSNYQVFTYLIFTQTVWSMTDLKNGFKRKNLFGFIAKNLETSDLYVVFRGTSNLGEWISNVKLIQQSYTTVKNPDAAGETHWGFRRTYERPESYNPKSGKILWATRWFDQTFLNGAASIRETVQTTLKTLCPPNAEKAKIYVTGHSLGGALATLATAHIKRLVDEDIISAHYPILYTFASPRVGDDKFAKAFENIECYRIANSEDLVPKIPLPTLLPVVGRLPARSGILDSLTKWLNKSLDFQHVGLPIYFTAQKGSISDNHTLPVYFEELEPPLSDSIL
jgi:triacylglycerol lipase